MGHSHVIIDDDNHFIIDPKTRKITGKTSSKNTLIQYDHNSEILTFEIPRFVNGHDMSLCDKIEINYTNVSSDRSNSNADIYVVDDLDTSNESTLYFSWLISDCVTQLDGSLSFSICFKCIENGAVVYAWHSDIYSNISILKVIHNSDIVIETRSDMIEALREELNSINNEYENWVFTLADGTEVTKKVVIA